MPTKNSKSDFGKFILNSILSVLFFPSMILLLSGSLRWIEGWIFGLWFDVMVLSNMIYLYMNDPALLAERSKLPGSDNQKQWDKYLLSATYILAILWLILMPLDAKRFGWSPEFVPWLKVLGGVMLLPSLYLIFMATVQNTFLSALVRIQTDRKHRVISTGVYGFVRHPLYLGCLLMIFGAPLLLGSIVGAAIGVIGTIGLIVRILGEEQMLKNELVGYADYMKKVKYRLIPFVW